MAQKNLSSAFRISPSKQPLVAIVGPTASGKSTLALRLAQKFDGEIICADSQTVRREMDIGTAKPSQKDQKLVCHHLLDRIGPYGRFTAADFQRLATQAIQGIHKRGRLPILVGGTGLYVDSVLFSYAFRGKTDPILRAQLNSASSSELQSLVRVAGYTMPENDKNPRHLIRVIESAGVRSANKKLRPNTLIFGLNPDKEILAERISKRVDTMFEQGFVEEVRSILKKYGHPPAGFDAIGYKIVLEHIDNSDKINYDQIKQAMKIADRQYAKRQMAWFKRNQNIMWVQSFEQAQKILSNYLRKFDTIDK